jgi:hypothetical protein
LLLFFAAQLEVFLNRRLKEALIFLVSLTLVIIAGLRFETGVDWYNYEQIFELIPTIYDVWSNGISEVFKILIDPGFLAISFFAKSFGFGVNGLFFIISVFCAILLYKNLILYTPYPITALLIYYCLLFFVLDMSGIRQALALQIFIFSIRYIADVKFTKFFLLFITATSIHWSIIFLFPLYFFLRIKIRNFHVLIIIIFGFLVNTLSVPIITSFIETSEFLFLILNSILNEKLNFYVGGGYGVESIGWSNFAIYNFLRLVLLISLCINYREKMASKNRFQKYFFNMLILEFIVTFYFGDIYVIAERMRLFFIFSEVVIISTLVSIWRQLILRTIFYWFFSFVVFINSYGYFFELPMSIAYNPYQNYLLNHIFSLNSDGFVRILIHKQTFKEWQSSK